MYQLKVLFALNILLLIGCNRQTSADEKSENISDNRDEKKTIVPEITVDDPFKDQPYPSCTIIRKLEVTSYAPEKNIDESDMEKYPPKYCLLDICLHDDTNSTGIINIGDETVTVTTYYQLIKVFETEEEAKSYAEKYKITDTEF
ncbi:MAG: hypothetical protein H7X71_00160 [Chitinophagales bacterium]|nr:hypothetical protein [Chitinophagales bacterium]